VTCHHYTAYYGFSFAFLQYLERSKTTHPLGYVGEPVDVAKAITYLAADDSSYITGQMLFVDGGRHRANL